MKEVVAYVVSSYGYGERRACQVTRQHRSTQRKPSTRDPRAAVRQRMHEIVATRIRWLSAGACDAEARRLAGREECRLSTVPRGRFDPAHQAASSPQDGRAPTGALPAQRAERSLELGNLTPAEYLAGRGFCMDSMGSMQVGS